MFNNILILGASRGLGRAIGLQVPKYMGESAIGLTLLGRKTSSLEAVASELGADPQWMGKVETLTLDLTKNEAMATLHEKISLFDLVVYAAGGGCYGPFESKDWKDHLWTLKLNLESPMSLCHAWLAGRQETKAGLFAVVGSRIAGLNPDPLATSYAAAKHGLFGFVSSLQPELAGKNSRVWLFSPGYMDTDLLPPNAEVRKQGLKIMAPEAAAGAFWRWVLHSGVGPTSWHRVLN